MESDWKAFRNMLPELRERYLENMNAQLARMLEAPNQTATERFWGAYEKFAKESRTLHHCLDGASRSRMLTMVCQMLDCGMMNEQDLTIFSEELQMQVRTWRRM